MRTLRAIALTLLAVGLVVSACGREKAAGEYYCPMHPTYVTDGPGTCPICNMDLEPRPPVAPAAGDAAHAPDHAAPSAESTPDDSLHGVPGYAPVTLDAQAQRLAGIQTEPATRARIMGDVRTVGTVRADEGRVQHFHVKVSGWAEKLYVRSVGQFVRRGDPVLVLDSPELVAGQEEFLRALRAERELSGGSLPDAQRGAEELLAAARRRLERYEFPPEALAQLERTGVALRVVTLTSHATGYVLVKDVVEGDRVGPDMELFTLADLSRVWIEAAVYENEAPLVRIGQPASLAMPFAPGRALTGTVAWIAPTVDAGSRTLTVRLEFANPDLALKPGMFVDVTLGVESAESVVVPESAVLDTGTRRVAFVETSPGRFEPRAVRIGSRRDGQVQVLEGVAAGERVVVRANFLLDSESRLRGTLAAPGAHEGHRP